MSTYENLSKNDYKDHKKLDRYNDLGCLRSNVQSCPGLVLGPD